jgi:hypothetical protein
VGRVLVVGADIDVAREVADDDRGHRAERQVALVEVSRHITIRHDYGLYEFTTYVYRDPSDPDMVHAKPLLRPAP